jgi:hypothetical protein
MTNKIIKYGLYLLFAGFIFAACEEKVVDKFEDASSLFFFRGDKNAMGLAQNDSISYSFFLAESSAKTDVVWVDVRLTGMPSDQARRLPIVQLNVGEPGSAIAGTHYVAFDDPRMTEYMVFPANKISTTIPVTVIRTSEMNTSEFRLDLGITSNEYFVAGIKGRTAYTIKITAMAVKPAGWDRYYDTAFGPWGQEKMRFIIDYVGFREFHESLLNADMRIYLNLKARAKLAEYENEHGPLYENDGITRVTFP